jgi:hypothetical protein
MSDMPTPTASSDVGADEVATLVTFAAVPLVVAVITAIHIPWLPVGAFVLIALGLLPLARGSSEVPHA